MLDDDDDGVFLRTVEQRRQLARRVGVQEVVPREFLALELAEAAEHAAAAHLPVDRGRLVRVLAVAGLEDLLEFEVHRRGEGRKVGLRPGSRSRLRRRRVRRPAHQVGLRRRVRGRANPAVAQPVGDRRVVAPRVAEGLERQPAADVFGEAALALERREHDRVVGRVHHDRDVGEVLGRRPDHAGPADVDHLHRAVHRRVRGRGGVLERVEVDRHQVDRGDLVLLEFVTVLRTPAVGEDAAEDAGVQALDPAVENLRVAGDLGHRGHRHAAFRELPRRTAGRDDLDAQLRQTRSKILEARLVEDRNQCAANGEHRRRRSVARRIRFPGHCASTAQAARNRLHRAARATLPR